MSQSSPKISPKKAPRRRGLTSSLKIAQKGAPRERDGAAMRSTGDDPSAEFLGFWRLRHANTERQRLWDPEDKISLEFRGLELGGEAGEALNAVKKIARERLGIAGSRATLEQLAEELADVVICADLIGLTVGIDLAKAVREKFNKRSKEMGFDVLIGGAS